jgi:superfamily II DNA or RNA helicase
MQLRQYQQQAIDDTRAAIRNGARAPLLVLPTGGGKTVIFATIAATAAAKGNRVLILVHRRELIHQASSKLAWVGLEHGIIAAGLPTTDALVQIASVQTLARRLAHMTWQPSLIIIDEAHHATAGQWERILNHWPDAYRLGVTATPCRLDGRGLGAAFDRLVLGPSVSDLIEKEYLSKYRVFCPPMIADLSQVKARAGDYKIEEAEKQMVRAEVTGDAVQHYKKYANGQKAIAFALTVAHAELVSEAFNESGIAAEVIKGEMSTAERESLVERFKLGTVQVLVSVNVVSEGFDCPDASCAIILRPTKSESLYLQQVGRVLRPAEGKRHAVILDHVANVPRHGLPCDHRQWSLEDKPAGGIVAVKQCPECFAVFHPQPTCPVCGADLSSGDPKDRNDKTYSDEELIEVQIPERNPQGLPVIVDFGDHAPNARGYFIDKVDSSGHYWIRKGGGHPFLINKSKVTIDSEAEQKIKATSQGKARTLEQLVELGKIRGMKNPAGWARHVYLARQRK